MPSKQEEIRKALIFKVKSIRAWRNNLDDPLSPEEDADDILRTLSSLGCVLTVEGENRVVGGNYITPEAMKTLKKHGYHQSIPLVEG